VSGNLERIRPFQLLGLKPGKFTIKVDDKQLGKLDYQSSPQLHQVEIEVSEYGTVVEGLDFQITSKDASRFKSAERNKS
jgi:hypothetical protein